MFSGSLRKSIGNHLFIVKYWGDQLGTANSKYHLVFSEDEHLKKKVTSTLLILCLFLPSIPVFLSDNWSMFTIYGNTVIDTKTTTTTGGPASTTPPPDEPKYLRLAVILSAILALIILTVIFNKRRFREPR